MNERPIHDVEAFEIAAEIDALFEASLAILNHRPEVIERQPDTFLRRVLPNRKASARIIDSRDDVELTQAMEERFHKTNVPSYVIKEWRDKKDRPTSIEIDVLVANQQMFSIHLPYEHLSSTYITVTNESIPPFETTYQSHRMIIPVVPAAVIPALQAMRDAVV